MTIHDRNMWTPAFHPKPPLSSHAPAAAPFTLKLAGSGQAASGRHSQIADIGVNSRGQRQATRRKHVFGSHSRLTGSCPGVAR